MINLRQIDKYEYHDMKIPESELKKLHTKLGEGLFRYIDCDQFLQMVEFMEHHRWRSGEPLWVEGGVCDYLAIIVSGEIEIMKETEFKGNRLIMGILGHGAVVGDLCLLDDEVRTVTAAAITDTSLLVIPKAQFERLLIEQPKLGVNLMKGMIIMISERLRQAYQRLSEVL